MTKWMRDFELDEGMQYRDAIEILSDYVHILYGKIESCSDDEQKQEYIHARRLLNWLIDRETARIKEEINR